MQRNCRFQTYVTAPVADWIRAEAQDRRVSCSIVISDCLFDFWQRHMDAQLRHPATDPVRQNVFITVALDALLTHHPDPTLRERTVAAYHRKLERLGLVAPRPVGGDHED
jgi:hypothetical protein